MELIVYINEVSLKDKDITKEYIEILEYLLSYGVKIYRNSKFKNIYNTIDIRLKKRLNDIFTNKRGETYKWDDEDCLNCGLTEVYFFDEEGKSQIEKDSSIGEFISRKVVNSENYYCFLLNFDNSHIRSNRELNIYEHPYNPKFTDIILFDNLEDIKFFCKEHIYTDLDFAHTPIDKQTILRNKSIFEKTNKPKQDGRTIYRNKENKYFYYIDNLHKGKGAELEVFNGSNHIGVADINLGKIDTTQKKNNRKID